MTVEPFTQLLPNYSEAFVEFGQKAKENFVWLSEVYNQALEAFSRPGIELLPKTPSQKTKQNKIKGRKRKSSKLNVIRFELTDTSLVHTVDKPSSSSDKTETVKRSEEIVVQEVLPVNVVEPTNNLAFIETTPQEVLARVTEIVAQEVSPEARKLTVAEEASDKTEEVIPVQENIQRDLSPPKVVEPVKTVTRSKARKHTDAEADFRKSEEVSTQEHVHRNLSPTKVEPLKTVTRSKARKLVDAEAASSKIEVIPVQERIQRDLSPQKVEPSKTVTRSKARKLIDAEAAASKKNEEVSTQQHQEPVSSTVVDGPRKMFGGGSAVKLYPPTTISRPPSTMFNSFMRSNAATTPLSNLPASVTSFIKRNTPLKVTGKEQELNLQEKIKLHEIKQQQAVANKEEMMKRKIEEQRKKRAEREQRVAAVKEQQKNNEEQQKRKLEEKRTALMQLREAEEQQWKKQKMMQVESEAKKREEEEQWRRNEELKARREAELKRIKEQERLQAEREEAEKMKYKKEAEQKAKAAHEIALKAKKVSPDKQTTANTSVADKSRQTFNVSASVAAAKLNSVVNNTSKEPESYSMTPIRQAKPSTDSNYDITDLNSSDDTDDEEAPRKKIPFWAQGAALKAALVQQYYSTDIDVEQLFPMMEAPDLTKMFKYQRKKFKNRTSSAIWVDNSFQAFHEEEIK